jgi:hypothetical protein
VSVEIRRIRGPLDDDRLAWIAELYGPVDPKYGSLDFLRHQFVANPFGWAAHVFALDDGRAVGHSGAVPFHARFGEEPIVAGKIEAVVVDAAHRGRREDGGSVATDVLSALYPFGLENGIDVLFGLAPPHVARVHNRAGCPQVPTDAPAYTFVADTRSFRRNERSRKRRLGGVALGAAQSAVLAAAFTAARAAARPSVRVEAPTAEDARLAAARTDARSWTISGTDAWDWYVGSGLLRAIEISGPSGCRALVRVDESHETTVQIVGWRPRREGLLPAVLLLGAAARIARERRAPTLRFQPWAGEAGDGALARACAALGFVKRPEADLLLYANDRRYDSVRLTPFFYVTF